VDIDVDGYCNCSAQAVATFLEHFVERLSAMTYPALLVSERLDFTVMVTRVLIIVLLSRIMCVKYCSIYTQQISPC